MIKVKYENGCLTVGGIKLSTIAGGSWGEIFGEVKPIVDDIALDGAFGIFMKRLIPHIDQRIKDNYVRLLNNEEVNDEVYMSIKIEEGM